MNAAQKWMVKNEVSDMKEKTRRYRYYDFITGKWYYLWGKDKYNAVYALYPKEQARFILKTFKIERVYD